MGGIDRNAHAIIIDPAHRMRDQALLAEYFCLNLDQETRAQVEVLANEENVTPQQMSLILLQEALYCDLYSCERYGDKLKAEHE